jgi:hypothetical protein
MTSKSTETKPTSCGRNNNLGAQGVLSLAAVLDNNATLTSLGLSWNNIGAKGARLLAPTGLCPRHNNATLTSLGLNGNNIGAQGAHSLTALYCCALMCPSVPARRAPLSVVVPPQL